VKLLTELDKKNGFVIIAFGDKKMNSQLKKGEGDAVL
jgi:hypothetical protein